MTIDAFCFNGQEIGTKDIFLNEKAFKAFVDQYGIEQGMGYLKAIQDVHVALYRVREQQADLRAVNRTVLRKNLASFIAHNDKILNICQTVLEPQQQLNSQPDL